MKKILFFFLFFPAALSAQTDNFKVDAIVSPQKNERIITVGGMSADIRGYTNEAIQVAVDALPVEGGTVKLNTGQFKMKVPVRLKSNVKLIGSGSQTVLKRIDGYLTEKEKGNILILNPGEEFACHIKAGTLNASRTNQVLKRIEQIKKSL